MTDWSSPEEVQKDAVAWSKFLLVLLGLWIWEYLITLDFEWDFITGKKKFRWPMVFYFAGRYSITGAYIGIIIANNVTFEVNCQALYTAIQALGNMSVGLASLNLSLRTMAVWSRSIYIVAPISFVIMGHWALLLYAIKITSYWDPLEMTCVINSVPPNVQAAIMLYTMFFDLLIMSLTAYKLGFTDRNSKHTKLVQMIFYDGLIYFFCAFIVNLISAVFSLLNLNAVMVVVGAAPSGVVSTIAACRAVRRLTNYTNAASNHGGVLSNLTPTANSAIQFGSKGTAVGSGRFGVMKHGQVHLQMETITTDSTRRGSQSFMELDAAGRPKTTDLDNYDPEAQVISEDFKRPPY